MAISQEQVDRAERVGMAEAKVDLSGIVARVESTGTPCVIMRYNRPVAMIVPFPGTAPRTNRARGILASYANPDALALEEGAFARAMERKHAADAS